MLKTIITLVLINTPLQLLTGVHKELYSKTHSLNFRRINSSYNTPSETLEDQVVALAGCSVVVLESVMSWLDPVSGLGGWGKGSGKEGKLLPRRAERAPDRLG